MEYYLKNIAALVAQIVRAFVLHAKANRRRDR